MFRTKSGTVLPFCFLFILAAAISGAAQEKKFGIVIHGGAGTILKSQMTPEKEAAYVAKLREALDSGYGILERGGTSLDAVEAAIRILEDSPLFNAGKGAVFTADGTNELDASIMDGKTLDAGAVGCVMRIKNPISLARMVMEKSEHVMLISGGAEIFARDNGMAWVDPEYFFTQERWDALQRAKKAEKDKKAVSAKDKHGTVGAVALDKQGNLAAGTSTGGMTNKKYGRVGDSSIVGAGTYANNETCAVSCTGWGEYFIRLSVARDISDLMAYKGLSLGAAAEDVIMRKLIALGGFGGAIAIDGKGNVAMPFNTEGMHRACRVSGEKPYIAIYKD